MSSKSDEHEWDTWNVRRKGVWQTTNRAQSTCLSCRRTFSTLRQVEEHSYESGHVDFRKNSEMAMDGSEIQRIPSPVKTKPDMPNAFPSSPTESSTNNETEEKVVTLSPEELVPDVCRIDGSYQPGTRTHKYDLFSPMLGPARQVQSVIPTMYSKWVLLLVREFNEDFELKKTFIRINSPLIKAALANGFQSKEAVFELSQLHWPNNKLFRYRERIRQAAKDISELAITHVAPLLQLIESEYAPRIQDLETMLPKGVASYELLEDIFMPGNIVVSTKASITRAYRIIDVSYRPAQFLSPPMLEVKAEYIDFDGERLGAVKDSLFIEEFEGVKYLHSLSVCPVDYLPNKVAVINELRNRGKDFLDLRGRHFKFYNGDALPLNKRDKFKVKSRVMVDSLMLQEFKPSSRVVVSVPADQHESEVSEENLIICTNQVPAFSFKDKTFFWADMTKLREISFNDQAFDQLILPVKQKELIQAFVNSYSNGDGFDDFIAGKGKGLCFLLHGPPGVGKTMTAEAISDLLRRPLYAVTSGELGTSPSEMERRLQKALDQAAYFSSVLLLDEADVFLEQRNAQDLTRNALVSTFLRLLEYYQGIMFLTTNRLESFDDAVSSRIHVTLRVNELDIEAREAVWRNLGKLNNLELDFATLAKLKLNGRQIKNAFRSGVILARDKGVRPSTEHIQLVLQATGLTNQSLAS